MSEPERVDPERIYDRIHLTAHQYGHQIIEATLVGMVEEQAQGRRTGLVGLNLMGIVENSTVGAFLGGLTIGLKAAIIDPDRAIVLRDALDEPQAGEPAEIATANTARALDLLALLDG